MVQYGCSPGSRFRLYVVTSMLGLASMLEVLPLTRRISHLRLLKGGATVNTTLCRTHELKSGDRRRPETERQGLAPRPSHDSRVAFREFVTHRSDSKIRLRTLRALTALLFEARKEKSCDLSPARSQPAPLEARQPRSKPWRRRLPPLPGLAERRRRAAQATTSAPPTGGAAAAAPTAPPSAAARGCRRDVGR